MEHWFQQFSSMQKNAFLMRILVSHWKIISYWAFAFKFVDRDCALCFSATVWLASNALDLQVSRGVSSPTLSAQLRRSAAGAPKRHHPRAFWVSRPRFACHFNQLLWLPVYDPCSSAVSLGRAGLVCKAWKEIADAPSLWRKLYFLPKWSHLHGRISPQCPPGRTVRADYVAVFWFHGWLIMRDILNFDSVERSLRGALSAASELDQRSLLRSVVRRSQARWGDGMVHVCADLYCVEAWFRHLVLAFRWRPHRQRQLR